MSVQLEGDDQDDIRRLAQEHKSGGAVTVVESQEDEDEAANINAVQGGRQRGYGRRGGQRGGGQRGGQRGSQRGGQCGGQQGPAVWAARAGASSRGGAGGKALTPSEAGGSGRRWHLLEPLAVSGECVPLQGLGGLSLQLAGKLMAWGCLKAVAPGQLVHIVDQLMGRHFLIDTGMIYSIFPLRSTRRRAGRS